MTAISKWNQEARVRGSKDLVSALAMFAGYSFSGAAAEVQPPEAGGSARVEVPAREGEVPTNQCRGNGIVGHGGRNEFRELDGNGGK